MERYLKNMNALTSEENESLRSKKACIIGCGGLGGFVIEILARIGVGTLTIVDGDAFVESNLNRQLFSDIDALGQNKAKQGAARIAKINPETKIKVFPIMLDEDNAKEILTGQDIVIDALDNVQTRKFLEEKCEEFDLPLVHGAIGGWFGQVTTIFPGDRTLSKIYGQQEKGIENTLGNPSFTPPLIASLQATEAIKFLVNKGELLRKKLLYLDILNHEYEIIDLNKP